MEITHPFYIEKADGESIQKMEVILGGKENRDVKIKIKAEEQEDKFCRLYKANLECTFKEHSKKVISFLRKKKKSKFK